MVDDDDSEQAAPNEASKETCHAANQVPPSSTWEDHANQETKQEDVAVLEGENWVCFEVFDLFDNGLILGNHHPSNVCPKETLQHCVWVIICIGDEVMTSMVTAPFDYGILERPRSKQCIKQTKWPCALVCSVREQAVVPCRDRKAACDVHEYKNSQFHT